MEIKQYDIVNLLFDINTNIKKGMKAVVLEKYDSHSFEIEVLDKEGRNIEYQNQFIFTVTSAQIQKVSE